MLLTREKHAGVELCQAQEGVLLARWMGGWTKTKLMVISTQGEIVVEVKVELGNSIVQQQIRNNSAVSNIRKVV